MSLRVARGVYNPEKERFHYYVSFKPTLDPTEEERAVERTYPVEVALSVTETGELADLAFSLPQPLLTAGAWNIFPAPAPPIWWKSGCL